MASDETRYTNKIFMAAALPLMKTIATDVPELKKKFEGRVLIRPSGTEPKVRVMIEGKDKERIDKEAHRIADLIQQLML